MFATCGQQVDVWDEERAEPVRSFTWGVDSITSVKFNPVEVCLLHMSYHVSLFCRTLISFCRDFLRLN